MEKDIYLCAIYIPPVESPYYYEEIFSILLTEITHFQAQGNVLLHGDLNERTGTEHDIEDPQGNNHMFGQTPLYISQWRLTPPLSKQSLSGSKPHSQTTTK